MRLYRSIAISLLFLCLLVPLEMHAQPSGGSSSSSVSSSLSSSRSSVARRSTSIIDLIRGRRLLRHRSRPTALGASVVVPGSDQCITFTDAFTVNDLRIQILRQVNFERRKEGLDQLTRNIALERAAQNHAEDMVRRDFFDHLDPEGVSPLTRMQKAGYGFLPGGRAGENLARGQRTVAQVVADWMSSPTHRINILSPAYKETGVGYHECYWVQTFASTSP